MRDRHPRHDDTLPTIPQIIVNECCQFHFTQQCQSKFHERVDVDIEKNWTNKSFPMKVQTYVLALFYGQYMTLNPRPWNSNVT